MIAASKVQTNIELLYHGAELEEQINLLDHYLDYIRKFCERDITEVGDQETEQ
jgi:hypothetical protein